MGRFRNWLAACRCTKDFALQIAWALSCIAELARATGYPSRARSACIDAEATLERWNLQHSSVAVRVRLQRGCADVALFGSPAEALDALYDSLAECIERGFLVDVARIAICFVDFNAQLGRPADALLWSKWMASSLDQLSPCDRLALTLHSADALTRLGRGAEALRLLGRLGRGRPAREWLGIPLPGLGVRVAEALVTLARPREALQEALVALEWFDRRKAFPGAARAHAVAAECYFATGSKRSAMAHIEQSQYLAERFGSPHQLLQTYAACTRLFDDRCIDAKLREMQHVLAARPKSAATPFPPGIRSGLGGEGLKHRHDLANAPRRPWHREAKLRVRERV